tara:strand:+ start:80 stop:628 length:549 start_codon:yes stop_codon:yes gene_type:complete
MSDDLDWKKAIENYDNRLEKEKEAKKRKNKKSKLITPRARFVQGGQTGLVQQNIKSPPPPPGPPGTKMIEYIYNTMTESYKMDIVLIHVGSWIETIKENAKWYSVNRHKERNLAVHASRGYPICGCGSIDILEDIKKFLKDEGKEFCFAKQTKVIDGYCTERTITFCTNKDLEGLAFYYNDN